MSSLYVREGFEKQSIVLHMHCTELHYPAATVHRVDCSSLSTLLIISSYVHHPGNARTVQNTVHLVEVYHATDVSVTENKCHRIRQTKPVIEHAALSSLEDDAVPHVQH